MPPGRPKGVVKTGGRQKGTPNKVAVDLKESFLTVYGKIGGDKALADWAKDNQSEFYKLLSKLLPTPQPLPPLEQLLGALQPEIAAKVRAAIADYLHPGGTPKPPPPIGGEADPAKLTAPA